MNTFWLKAAGIAVGLLIVIVLVSLFLPSEGERETQPERGQDSFYEVARRDKQRFLTGPEAANSVEPEPEAPQDEPGASSGAGEPSGTQQKPPHKFEQVTLYFSELSEIEQIEAERLLNVAVPGRSIGRLPVTGFKLMVDSCRQIIERWPDSWYAYRAKQMLADMPDRFRSRYNVTEEELDMSRFAEPRPGTKPFTMKNFD